MELDKDTMEQLSTLVGNVLGITTIIMVKILLMWNVLCQINYQIHLFKLYYGFIAEKRFSVVRNTYT